MKLTDIKIRKAKPESHTIRLSDGGSLYLEIKPNGTKRWEYRYRLHGKQRTASLGVYPEISLAQARDDRDKIKSLVRKGIDPTRHNRAEKARIAAEQVNTFEGVSKEWIAKNQNNWSEKYLNQIKKYMDRDIYPSIGKIPIREISPALLLDIITRVEKRGAPNIAILIRQWCSGVFQYAVVTLRADYDPASALKGAIKKPKVRHNPHLEKDELPDFLKTLESFSCYQTTKIAIKLLMLTFVRTVELRAAKWNEFNLDCSEWRIPAERMKMGEAHIIPLSSQAVILLKELQTITGKQCWLFPNTRRPKDCMTPTTINRAIERMGYKGKLSGHGFRGTASTILHEMGYKSDIIERQLAHKERNAVRAAYNHAQYMNERITMMQEWADFIDSINR